VSDKAKVEELQLPLPHTILYDLDTQAGKTYTFVKK
jgi:alpha-L-fucosidase 2